MNKLVIFGVGLIGGSVAKALKRANAADIIVGLGRNGENLQTALELGVIDEAQSDIATAVKDADIILIAAPVAQTPAILQAINPHLGKHTVITDAGSTKSDIVSYATEALGRNIPNFVPGHPIAGAEKSGVLAAQADLYIGKNVVLTPTAETASSAVEQVRKMWEDCGASVTTMSAETHDRIFAAVSHLPHLLAFALVHELTQRDNAKQLFDFAASGFRDFTRIAGSHAEMWRDISLANRTALLHEIDAYQAQLQSIRTLIDQENGQELQKIFEVASKARNGWAGKKT